MTKSKLVPQTTQLPHLSTAKNRKIGERVIGSLEHKTPTYYIKHAQLKPQPTPITQISNRSTWDNPKQNAAKSQPQQRVRFNQSQTHHSQEQINHQQSKYIEI